jgi:hypothetical protein
VLSGKQRAGEEPLAGKSTLNRLELGGEAPSRYKKIQYRQEYRKRGPEKGRSVQKSFGNAHEGQECAFPPRGDPFQRAMAMIDYAVCRRNHAFIRWPLPGSTGIQFV